MDKIELNASNREVLGKKVRRLRRQGITPVHLFGHGIESTALQCDATKLKQVLAKAGQTRLISLKLDNEKRPRTVVVRTVQTEPLTGGSLHVDFFQVEAAEKVKVEIPVVLVGEAPALGSKENILVRELSTLTVECLPAHIPTDIELDISSLTKLGQTVRVKDIELDKDITVLSGPELAMVRIRSRLVEKVEEKEIVAEEAAETPEAASLPEQESKEK
jgi:large subunit ribosomal protein L25